MPRRHNDQNFDEPPRKKSFTIPVHSHVDIEAGEILTDLSGQKWKLGKPIGLGGFGIIHEIVKQNSRCCDKYVVKIEGHSSGPLFTEINCYLRIARKEMIEQWKKKKALPYLGMPYYVASGSHIFKDEKYRFLVLPRYEKDLELILQQKKKLNLKTVLLISSRILHILEYTHSKGYIHSDIKAANIMLGQVKSHKTSDKSSGKLSTYSKSPVSDSKSRYPRLRTCKARKLTDVRYYQFKSYNQRYDTRKVRNVNYNEDLLSEFHDEMIPMNLEVLEENGKPDTEVEELFLLDFGLASKYKLSSGEHKKSEDERKAHAGTLLFCSRDAHKGMPSRRSDLESLAYNMVYWLTGSLPWIEDIENPEMIQRKKRHCFSDPSAFLYICMPDPPRILQEFFQYIKDLDVQAMPNYNSCQQSIKKALVEHGYQDDGKFDFDNLEGWGLMRKKPKMVKPRSLIDEFKRPPLLSNMPIKPILRKKIKNKKAAVALYWSRMLSDPEVLLKKVRRGVESNEHSPTFLDFDIHAMNPTPAMRDIYQRYEERQGQSPNRYDETDAVENCLEGFTPAMVCVWKKMMEERALEDAVKSVKKRGGRKYRRKTKKSSCIDNSQEPSKTKSRSIPLARTYSLRG